MSDPRWPRVQPGGPGERPLLVEDDSGDALLIEALIAEHPDPPVKIGAICSTIAEAKARLAMETFDLVLLDLHLPDSQGWETFLALRYIINDLPVVVLSGLADEELAERAVSNGAQDYLIKGEAKGTLLCRMLLHAIERHRFQSALRVKTAALDESNSRFRTVVDELPDGLVIYEPGRSEPLLVNRAARQLIGDDASGIARWLQERSLSEPIRIDGPPKRFIDVRAGAVIWGGREVVSVLLRDVTERQQNHMLRQRLQGAQLRAQQAEELSRMRSEMIATVTHELRTPLTPLRSVVDLLLEGAVGPLSPAQRNLIELLGANVNRLTRFTDKMLTAARLDAEPQVPPPQEISLPQALDPIIELVERGCDAHIEVESSGLHLAWANLDDFAQVVTNLVSNAIVHNASGVRVRVSVETEADRVVLRVEDDGRGIPVHLREAIFDRFVQLDDRVRSGHGGIGLGLAICRSLMKRNGGRIEVEDGTLGGACFMLSLRRAALS